MLFASRILFRPMLPIPILAAAVTASSLAILQPLHRRPLRCETASRSSPSSFIKRSTSGVGNRLNSDSIKQISSGSLLGLTAGIAVSFFSKPLAIILGLFVAGVQYLEYKGIHIIPYSRLQSYFSGIDLKSFVDENVAFKISFGATFALAGFASF